MAITWQYHGQNMASTWHRRQHHTHAAAPTCAQVAGGFPRAPRLPAFRAATPPAARAASSGRACRDPAPPRPRAPCGHSPGTGGGHVGVLRCRSPRAPCGHSPGPAEALRPRPRRRPPLRIVVRPQCHWFVLCLCVLVNRRPRCLRARGHDQSKNTEQNCVCVCWLIDGHIRGRP